MLHFFFLHFFSILHFGEEIREKYFSKIQNSNLDVCEVKKNPNFCSTIIYEFHMKNASYTQKSVIDQASNWSLKIPIVLICTNYILIAINGPDKRQNDDLIEENRSFYS